MTYKRLFPISVNFTKHLKCLNKEFYEYDIVIFQIYHGTISLMLWCNYFVRS